MSSIEITQREFATAFTKIPAKEHNLYEENVPMLTVICSVEINRHIKRIKKGEKLVDLIKTKKLALCLQAIEIEEINLCHNEWLVDAIHQTKKWPEENNPGIMRGLIFEQLQFLAKELLHISTYSYRVNVDESEILRTVCIILSDTAARYDIGRICSTA